MIKKKILIVEDEFIGAVGLAGILSDWGHETCEIASTGEDAIRITEGERPDMVLMDIKLRGKMDGIEAAKDINCRFKIPVIFMSGYSEERIRMPDLCGSFYFIDKPIDFDELEAVLADL